MIRRTAWVNLRVKGERGHGSKLPSGGWLGEPKRLPRPGKCPGEGYKQAPRPPACDSNDRTRNCPPPQDMRHYTTGSEPVKPVACFSGFRGRARPDQHFFLTIDSSELKPQLRALPETPTSTDLFPVARAAGVLAWTQTQRGSPGKDDSLNWR
jgi:hypothetical protein